MIYAPNPDNNVAIHNINDDCVYYINADKRMRVILFTDIFGGGRLTQQRLSRTNSIATGFVAITKEPR